MQPAVTLDPRDLPKPSEPSTTSPKPTPRLMTMGKTPSGSGSIAASGNPRIVLLAGLGMLLLIIVAVIGVISGMRSPQSAEAQTPEGIANPAGQATPGAAGATIIAPGTPVAPGTGMVSAEQAMQDARRTALQPGPTGDAGRSAGQIPDRGIIDPSVPVGRTLVGAGAAPAGPVLVNPGFPPAPPRATPASSYIVKESDTLWSIARQVYGDGNAWPRIAKANLALNPARLTVGMKLQIPAHDTTPTGASTGATQPRLSTATGQPAGAARQGPAPTGTRSVVIRQGDTLFSIARREYGDGQKWDAIYAANRGRIANPNVLPIGKAILIPAKAR
ncbi:MAG: LysM peptidoglycan-binding domain-containing protein [Phycisphaeraceae bacterium]